MNVIAINEYDNDFCVAVVEISEGKTADETFCEWYRQNDNEKSLATNEELLDDDWYIFEELEIIKL